MMMLIWGSAMTRTAEKAMNEFSREEAERRKQAVFDAMSPRRQKHILKKGYEAWDPFQEPKDPIDIRKDRSRRTVHMLVDEFIVAQGAQDTSSTYRRGVLEIAMGIVNQDERYQGMYEFSCWYRELLKKEGLE
jgi:hypothetical protein